MHPDINEQKNNLRKQIRELKKTISDEEKMIQSQQIFNQLIEEDVLNEAKTILLYWSLPDEVNTHLWVIEFSKSKQIILPVVKGSELELRYFTGIEQLEKGNSFGIFEPTGEICSSVENIDLAIIPGLAFDKQNQRLGRGKAFYDKLLNNISIYKIGVCFQFQYFDEIPCDSNDIPMNKVIVGF